jgi:hypothetical protein
VRELLAGAPDLAALAGAPPAGEGLALAIALAIGPSASAEAVAAALASGLEPESRAWLYEAARRHRLSLDAAALRAELRSLGRDRSDLTAAHRVADVLRVAPLARGRPADLRALERAISSGLFDPRVPVRAAAAYAAAERGDAASAAAIEALLDDPFPPVRLAAANALSRCAPDRRRAILARAVVETDPSVAAVLEAIGRGEPLPPRDVLVVETIEHRPAPAGPIWLEVATLDGLLRRLPVSPRGTLVLPDVPGLSAEVGLSLAGH